MLAVPIVDPPFDQLEGIRKKYGDIVGLFFGLQPAVLISGAELVKEISAKEEFTFKPSLTVVHHKMFDYKKLGSAKQFLKFISSFSYVLN